MAPSPETSGCHRAQSARGYEGHQYYPLAGYGTLLRTPDQRQAGEGCTLSIRVQGTCPKVPLRAVPVTKQGYEDGYIRFAFTAQDLVGLDYLQLIVPAELGAFNECTKQAPKIRDEVVKQVRDGPAGEHYVFSPLVRKATG